MEGDRDAPRRATQLETRLSQLLLLSDRSLPHIDVVEDEVVNVSTAEDIRVEPVGEVSRDGLADDKRNELLVSSTVGAQSAVQSREIMLSGG